MIKVYDMYNYVFKGVKYTNYIDLRRALYNGFDLDVEHEHLHKLIKEREAMDEKSKEFTFISIKINQLSLALRTQRPDDMNDFPVFKAIANAELCHDRKFIKDYIIRKDD